ncbi:hypothetical protein AAHE18_16G139400 [Arachis hypogaea]
MSSEEIVAGGDVARGDVTRGDRHWRRHRQRRRHKRRPALEEMSREETVAGGDVAGGEVVRGDCGVRSHRWRGSSPEEIASGRDSTVLSKWPLSAWNSVTKVKLGLGLFIQCGNGVLKPPESTRTAIKCKLIMAPQKNVIISKYYGHNINVIISEPP